MKNYAFIIVLLVLFSSCEKNSTYSNQTIQEIHQRNDELSMSSPCEDGQQEIDISDYAYEYEGSHPDFEGTSCYRKRDFMNDLIHQMMYPIRCLNQLTCIGAEHIGDENGLWVGDAGCLTECTPGGLLTFDLPCVDDQGDNGTFQLFNSDGSIDRQKELLESINQQILSSKPEGCENSLFRINDIYLMSIACSCPTYNTNGDWILEEVLCSDLWPGNLNLHLSNTSIFADVSWYCCDSNYDEF